MQRHDDGLDAEADFLRASTFADLLFWFDGESFRVVLGDPVSFAYPFLMLCLCYLSRDFESCLSSTSREELPS